MCKRITGKGDTTSAVTFEQKAYWTAFHLVLNTASGPVAGNRKPPSRQWSEFPIGRTGFNLAAVTLRKQNQIRAELYLGGANAKAFFGLLKQQKDPIEQELNYPLEWQELPARQDCRIASYLNSVNPEEESDWLRQHEWLAKRLNDMHGVFAQRIRELNADDLAVKLGGSTEASVVAPDLADVETYTIDHAIADLFLRREDIERLTDLLRRKKNLVLQGPPGTGKTYLAQRLTWLLAGEYSRDRIEVVQFHQSYGYEDFVRGYRPTEAGGFELQDGPFLHVCERARKDPDRPHVLVIDEINRGNLSRVFGELLMLIEADKRSAKWAVRMAYARHGEGTFYVPPNLYLIGTMNTADRSLALVDYALRRRFAFWTADPAFSADRFTHHLGEHGVPEPIRHRISVRLDALNDQILKDPQLGAGFRIGHSYFCQPPEGLTSDDAWNGWYTNVVRYEIEPLLGEYWFDNTNRAAGAVAKLLAAD